MDGLTASAKEQFIRGLEDAGAQVEEIHLNTKKLDHCRACGNGWGTCNKTGACVIKDDFEEVYRTISEADGIVWISAVYWSDMTECFKAFFDRLRRCDATHYHFLAEKRCVLIACAGGTGRGTLECLTQLERGLTHMGMRVYDRITVNGKTGIVLNVYTCQSYRRRGYAKKIMEILLEEAKRMELSVVELKSTEDGYSLYRSIGFTDDGSRYRMMKWKNR